MVAWGGADHEHPERSRCERHLTRNPCAIEGCTRSRERNGDAPSLDKWLCSEHWRRFVPARSLRRRTYHAFFRRAKRHGWDDDLKERFWRFWALLIATARRKAGGGPPDRMSSELERFLKDL